VTDVITDEIMHEMLARSKGYTVMLLKAGPKYNVPVADAIVWEHGRRSFELRAGGLRLCARSLTTVNGAASASSILSPRR
jgi:hypothetical protein